VRIKDQDAFTMISHGIDLRAHDDVKYHSYELVHSSMCPPAPLPVTAFHLQSDHPKLKHNLFCSTPAM
jgi:hypothetical protein